MATLAAERRRNGSGSRFTAPVPSVVRCAIYCRQSVSDGTGESASIMVQRESCQAFIESQRHEGWIALPDVYADQGISGATLKRPAMQRLLADIEAGRVTAVVCYKIDRISRSLLDFVNLVDALESRGVRLISTTQQFDTRSALGRLTLSLLASFSEFERSIIRERTRDSIAAAKKKGKWCGGCAVFGYDIVEKKLVPNEIEAHRVREAFRIYLETSSLIATAEELNRRGWRTKETMSKTGPRGNKPWNKGVLHGLLTNPILIGKVVSGGEAYAGNHEAILDEALWTAVQSRLESNAVAGSSGERHASEALLAGILVCAECGSAMTPSSARKGVRKYAYYRCSKQVKQGRSACPAKHVSAPVIEAKYVAEIARHATDPKLVEAVVCAARDQLAERMRALSDEARSVRRAIKDTERERTSADGGSAHIDGRIGDLRQRALALEREREVLDATRVEPEEIAALLAGSFDDVWAQMTSRERRTVVALLQNARM